MDDPLPNPFSPETVENPFPLLERLRRQHPVYLPPGGQYHLVTRFEDCRQAALAVETFSSNMTKTLFSSDGDSGALLQMPEGRSEQNALDLGGGLKATDVLAIADPPEHTRQRKLVNKAFAPRRVAALEPAIRKLAEELFDGLGEPERCDGMPSLAVPLPMMIIGDLVGIPRADAPRIQTLSDAAVSLTAGTNTPEQLGDCVKSIMALAAYLAERFDEATKNPRDDVLGVLVRASRGEGELLTRNEVVMVLMQLMTAGQETTQSLIGSAILRMIDDEDVQRELRTRPEVLEAFIEEVLRLESPFYGNFRMTQRDTELAGTHLQAGTRVMLVWASANRDEAVFPRPDVVDLKRPNPRAHLAFGVGPHACLGSELARMEARIALETLIERTRWVALDRRAPAPTHWPSALVRHLAALPLQIAWR